MMCIILCIVPENLCKRLPKCCYIVEKRHKAVSNSLWPVNCKKVLGITTKVGCVQGGC